MNKDYTQDIRYCQKWSQSQTFIDFDMLQKKVRPKITHKEDQIIKADPMIRQINYFWKKGWQREHFHPFIHKPISISPSVIIRTQQKDLTQYDHTICNLIERLQMEIQQDSTYRINKVPLKVQQGQSPTFQKSLQVIKTNLKIMQKLTQKMIMSMEQSENYANEKQYDDSRQYLLAIIPPLRFIQSISNLQNYNQKQDNQFTLKLQKIQQLAIFSDKFSEILQSGIQNKKSSCLFTVQPKIDHLTYALHPIIHSIEVFFEKYAQKQKQQINPMDQQQIPKLGGIKDIYQNPRIVFVNLDGYESQFNLQFARSHPNNFMYVSFVKERLNGKKNYQKHQSLRFWKKLMFKFSQIIVNDDNDTEIMQKISKNPQQYQENVNKFYYNIEEDNFNKNIYCIPLGWKIFLEQFHQILSNQDIQSYQSNIVRYFMLNFINSKIRDFHPDSIIISYSGRLHIQNNHLVEIMQQLTLCCFKLVFFPNLTTYFCQKNIPEMLSHQQLYYDNIIENYQLEQQKLIHILQVMMAYLKISSGTYNLSPSSQGQSLVSKFKNGKAFRYAYEIAVCLSHQYNSFQCLKSTQNIILFLDRFYSQNLKNSEKIIQKSVPIFYRLIYEELQRMLEFQKTSFGQDDYLRQFSELKNTICGQGSWEYHKSQINAYFAERKFLNFLEISSQKYHETAHLYFYTQQDLEPLEKQTNTIYNINSLQGVYFVTFSDSQKQTLPLYSNTQIIYKNRQITYNSNFYHLIIANHLKIQDKRPQNYISLIKKNNIYYKEQRSQVRNFLFIAQNGQILQQAPYKVRTQWNYTQTSQYLILFWPTYYDFLKATLCSMVKFKYQPPILNQIFIAHKITNFKKIQILFQKTDFSTDYDICPRVGCSVYQMSGKLFIFGGFYEREKNYLQLQHDITTFDLGNWSETHKVEVSNIKRFLYSPQTTEMRIKRGEGANSYVRPRMEFEFYQINELQREDNAENKLVDQDQQFRKVIMFGGYGQNFIRPYSLLTYYYYELTFDNLQRKLTSLQKKIIYGKAVPINLKSMAKNKNIYNQINYFDETDNTMRHGTTTPNQYLFHRLSYCLVNNNLDFKIKTFYSTPQYHLPKKEFEELSRKLGQYIQPTQNQSIQMVKINQANHYILINKGQKKTFIMNIYYLQQTKEQSIHVKLTNQSIISIDIKNNKVYAIIKHPSYTKNKSVLAVCDITIGNNLKSDQTFDGKVIIVLKYVTQFTIDLSLHCVLACNQNLILLLHGPIIDQNFTIPQFCLKIKYDPQKQSHQLKKSQPLNPTFLKIKTQQSITYIIKMDLKIQCFSFSYDYLCPQILIISFQQILLAQITINWNRSIEENQNLYFLLSKKVNDIQVPIVDKVQIVEIRKNSQNQPILLIQYNLKRYYFQLNNKKSVNYKNYNVYLINIEQQFKEQQWNKGCIGKIIRKNINKYDDIYQ